MTAREGKKKKRGKDTAFLTWNSRAQNPTPPEEATLETHELVIPNLAGPLRQKPLPDPLACPSMKDKNPGNRLIWGDNLTAMEALINQGYEGKAELVYIDPPFGSNAGYSQRLRVEGFEIERRAYDDTWAGGIDEYLEMLHPRLRLMKRLLSGKGKIFVHCDWRVNSYIRVLMDEVFGRKCFLNEIVWNYGGRGAKATSGQFPRNHDTILVYGRTEKARLKKLYSEKLLTLEEALSRRYREDDRGRLFKTAPRGDYTDKSIRELEKQGRIHRTRSGSVRVKYFLERRGRKFVEKKLVGDVWDDIPDAMHSPAVERTAFTTQKPEALIKRIIESATERDDLVCDFFSGSGTTGVVAEKLGRRWIMCEEGHTGIQVSRGRLLENARGPFLIEKVKKAGKKKTPSPRANRLRLLKPSIKKIPGGKVSVAIALGGYTPGELPGDFTLTGRASKKSKVGNGAYGALLDAARKNFAVLIESWSIDWDYDGRVFKSMWQTLREKRGKGGDGKKAGTVETEARAVLDNGTRKIAVRVVDVFGRETQKIVEI